MQKSAMAAPGRADGAPGDDVSGARAARGSGGRLQKGARGGEARAPARPRLLGRGGRAARPPEGKGGKGG